MKQNQLKHTLEEIASWGEDYKKGLSLNQLSQKYNVPYDTVKVNLTRFGYRTPIKRLDNQRVTPITYFDNIDSDTKAYFLGFLYADGYISETPYGVSWGMALQSNDAYILDILKKELGVSNKITTYKNSSKLSITCQYACEKLQQLGIKFDKSHSDYTIPNIPQQYIAPFIRGYFDGDGCITIKATGYASTSICCNSKKFLEDLKQHLDNQGITSRPIATEKRTNNPLYVLYITKREEQLKFYNYLYSDNCICLTRKKDKFMQIPRKTKA